MNELARAVPGIVVGSNSNTTWNKNLPEVMEHVYTTYTLTDLKSLLLNFIAKALAGGASLEPFHEVMQAYGDFAADLIRRYYEGVEAIRIARLPMGVMRSSIYFSCLESRAKCPIILRFEKHQAAKSLCY